MRIPSKTETRSVERKIENALQSIEDLDEAANGDDLIGVWSGYEKDGSSNEAMRDLTEGASQGWEARDYKHLVRWWKNVKNRYKQLGKKIDVAERALIKLST